MRRVAGLNYRTLALGVAVVVLMGLVLGSVGIGAVAGAVSHSPKAHSTPDASRASPTPANQGQATTTILIGVVYTPSETFPGNVTFYTNITYGVISNSTTFVSVVANGSTGLFVVASGNGTVNSHGVTTFTDNGIPYSNYTWTVVVGQDEFTPNCANPQCEDVIGAPSGIVNFTIVVLEKGASGGGGTAVNTMTWGQYMVGTQFTAGFLTPSTDDTAMTTFTPFNPLNFSVSFWLNTSQIELSNATQNVWLGLELNDAPAPTPFISFNDTINWTIPYDLNVAMPSGFNTSNGTSWTGYWANETYSTTINATTLGFSSWAAAVAALGTGITLNLVVGVGVTGLDSIAIAGNAFNLTTTTGTTYAFGGTFVQPVPFQALPYTASGWLNLSYVAPQWNKGNAGNDSYTAFFELWDGKTNLKTYDANDSVNLPNGAGILFSPASNGTTALGGTWVNYTWYITINPADVAGTAYGDSLTLTVNVTVNGVGGALAYNSVGNATVFTDTLAQHPTVVSTTYTTPITGYIDVSSAPYLLNWTLSVTNGTITPAATSLELQVVDATIPAPIMNYTIAITPGETAYSFPLTASTFTSCNTQVCGETAPTDDFYFTLIAVENGVYGPTNGSLATSISSIGPAFFIGTAASITLLSPSGATPTLPAGNVTFTTFYSGFFVSSANLTVYSGTVVVFTALMTQLVAGVPATATWTASAAGTYHVVVAMSLTSGPPVYANQTLTITSSSGSLVYQNSSTYHNVTLLGSLSPAVAGTILLLVGLIVGMIVALLVGRMMWGGSKPQEPPQQWEQGQPAGGSESGTGTTESGGTDTGTPPSGGS